MTFLIKKPTLPGDITTFKLTSAEEVVAKLVSETDKVYKVERPMTLSYSPQGVGMTPWLITAERDAVLEIPKDRVMTTTPTMKQVVEQYSNGV